MTLNNQTISRGFLLAGLMNVTVLLFSRFFTNATIPEYDPEVMSNFGLLMIVLWGLAYMAVSKNYQTVKWLIALFAIEKLAYGIVWIQWLLHNNLTEVFQKDIMAGAFYAIYGLNDLLFCVFFLFVFFRILKTNTSA